jgi:hypothetical protein
VSRGRRARPAGARVALALACLAVLLDAWFDAAFDASLAVAEEAEEAEQAEEDEPPGQDGVHGAAGAGVFVGVTGRARAGLAAEAQVYPGRWPGQVLGGHFGLGVRYRGWDGLSSGLVAGGLVYQAGATRPHFVLEVHGDVGVAYGPTEPLLGGGVRVQLGVWGPVAVAVAADVYYWFDGERPRPIAVPAVTVALAR